MRQHGAAATCVKWRMNNERTVAVFAAKARQEASHRVRELHLLRRIAIALPQ
jgi:hypothetical protein